MSLFTINSKAARLHKFLPNRGKSDEAPITCEIQIRNAVCLPSSAAAVVLAEGDAAEFEKAFFGDGGNFPQRFYGINEIDVFAEFSNRHRVRFEGPESERVALIDKIKLRIEGGPQRLVWADFSIHIDDPSIDLVAYLHEHCNRDVSLQLTQEADLVDEMIASRKGMAVSTPISESGDLDLSPRDREQIDQAAAALSGSAELPLKTKRVRPADWLGTPPKKAPAKKRAAKKRAARRVA